MLFVCSVSWLFLLGCQYQCKWLTGKTRLRSDLYCVDGDIKPCSLTHSFSIPHRPVHHHHHLHHQPIIPSLFHSRLHIYLFHKSFSPATRGILQAAFTNSLLKPVLTHSVGFSFYFHLHFRSETGSSQHFTMTTTTLVKWPFSRPTLVSR